MVKVYRRALFEREEPYTDEQGNTELKTVKADPYMKYNSIEDKDGILKMTFTFLDKGQEINREIELSKEDYRNQVIDLAAICTTEWFKVEPFSAFSIIDYKLQRHDNSGNSRQNIRVARIIFEQDGTVVIGLFHNHDAIPETEDYVMDAGKSITGCLIEASPLMAERQAAISKKYSMIKETDVYKSVAYLEAQLDLVTRILLKLVDGDEDYLVSLLQKADDNSVLNIKPYADIEKEFTESKAALRNKQEAYYNVLRGGE